MSHPNNFVEGTFQSEIPRCEHDVFLVTKDRNGRASNCSICQCNYKGPPRPLVLASVADVRAVEDETEIAVEELSIEAVELLRWSVNHEGEVRNDNEESETNAKGEPASSTLSGEGGDEAPSSDESGTVESIFDEESGGKQ